MADTVFCRGNPTASVPYTPNADIAAGKVVLQNDLVGISHLPIAADVQGSLRLGGGTYTVTADGAIGAGKKVYWDNTAKKITLTSSGNKVFGFSVTAAAADGDAVEALHWPS